MTRAIFLNEDLKESYLQHYPDLVLVDFEKFIFSGGESHFKITEDLQNLTSNTDEFLFITKLKTAQDITDLAIAVNAFSNLGSGADFHLLIGYLPGGRQDRVCVEGEAHSAKVYANLINHITDWSCVQFLDAHSDVMPSLIDCAIPNDNTLFVDKAIEALDLEDFVLVSPDAGANKKVLSLAKHLNKTIKVDVIRADKLRDMNTGEILETIVYADDLTNKNCVIVDDICDGGRTFIELAQVLKSKGAKSVILIVTHGIFSKGYDVVLKHVDQIVTTNTFADLSHDDGDKVTIIGINQTFYKSR